MAGVAAHFAEDVECPSPSVLAMRCDPRGVLRGRAAIAARAAQAFARYPRLRFVIETVLERGHRVLVFYRKYGVFAEPPGPTVEVFAVDG